MKTNIKQSEGKAPFFAVEAIKKYYKEQTNEQMPKDLLKSIMALATEYAMFHAFKSEEELYVFLQAAVMPYIQEKFNGQMPQNIDSIPDYHEMKAREIIIKTGSELKEFISEYEDLPCPQEVVDFYKEKTGKDIPQKVVNEAIAKVTMYSYHVEAFKTDKEVVEFMKAAIIPDIMEVVNHGFKRGSLLSSRSRFDEMKAFLKLVQARTITDVPSANPQTPNGTQKGEE